MPLADTTTTINVRMPNRRWSRPFDINITDTVTDKNLQHNSVPFKYIQNVGTSGGVVILWEPDGVIVDIYLSQGQVIEGGLWRHARAAGTGVGVDLRGFLGIEGRDQM